MVLAFYHLQCYHELEITHGQHGIGNYHPHTCFTGLFDDQKLLHIHQKTCELVSDLSTTFDGQDIPQQSHERIASQESRANKLLDEGKVLHNPSFKVFTVMGKKGLQAVTLFPKDTCTSTVRCYHIIAARMSESQ